MLTTVSQIDIKPINARIGAEVSPGDLTTASDAVIEQVRDALHEHQVIFMRGQHLSEEELLRFGTRLGEPMIMPMALFRDEPPVATFEITPDRPPRADSWHTDVPFYEAPPAYGMLSNLIAPEVGGDTIFSSSYEAYNALSPTLQSWCDTLKIHFVSEGGLVEYAKRESGDEAARIVAESCRPRDHPLVLRHPHTGRKALFMSIGFVDGIVGLKPAESDALLRLLRAPYDDPNNQVRWRWTAGDLAIWDQRAVNHRGLSDHFPRFPHRKMQSLFILDGIAAGALAVA